MKEDKKGLLQTSEAFEEGKSGGEVWNGVYDSQQQPLIAQSHLTERLERPCCCSKARSRRGELVPSL